MAETAQNDAQRRLDLAESSWARLLFAFLSQRFTGRVDLELAGARHGSVAFIGGFCVWSDWPADNTALADLLRTGRGSGIDAAAALIAEHGETAELLGALLASGALAVEAVQLALRDQAERRAESIFALRTGTVVITGDPALPDEVVAALMPARTLRVVQRGVRLHYDVRRIAAEAEIIEGPGALEISAAYDRYRDRFDFGANELRVLDELRGKGGFVAANAGQTCGLSPGRLPQLLFTLWATQMLGPGELGGEAEVANDSDQGDPIRALAQRADAGEAPHVLLGLGAGASAREINDAAQGLLRSLLASELAPDRHEEAEAVVVRMRDAARRWRLAQIERDGYRLLAEERFSDAIPPLEELLLLTPGEPRTRAALAWCRFQTSTRTERETKRAADALEKILREDDELATAHVYRGLLLRELGQTAAAHSAFARAQELEPTNVDTQRHARALRSAPKSGDKGKAGASRSSARVVRTIAPPVAPIGHVLWTPMWKRIWLVAGILAFVMLAAQIGLRLDI